MPFHSQFCKFSLLISPSGNTEDAFVIGGPTNSWVLVAPNPGPSGNNSFFNLTIGATNNGIPPRTGLFYLQIDVYETVVIEPTAGQVCYVDFPCDIYFRPAQGLKCDILPFYCM